METKLRILSTTVVSSRKDQDGRLHSSKFEYKLKKYVEKVIAYQKWNPEYNANYLITCVDIPF